MQVLTILLKSKLLVGEQINNLITFEYVFKKLPYLDSLREKSL